MIFLPFFPPKLYCFSSNFKVILKEIKSVNINICQNMNSCPLFFTAFGFFIWISLFSFHADVSNAQEPRQFGDPIVIQVIQLDHANAENLASVLAPLFPKEVQIIAYSPTNSLIIKGKKSLVKELVKIIKGNSHPFIK